MAKVLGWMTDEVRMPMTRACEESRKAVDAALAHAGLI